MRTSLLPIHYFLLGVGFTHCHVEQESSEHKNELSCTIQVQVAQNAFLNTLHPLEILSDRGAYGSGRSISRDCDSGNYFKAINCILRQQQRIKHVRKLHREQNLQRIEDYFVQNSPCSCLK
ncbi:hypothetical protein SUGI_0234110 [Cryptomeria japonica]|nr:hypothetical protein SUGI_0234110 [Cryptomeria japonica]